MARRQRTKCLVKSCYITVPHGLLMCPTHWNKLSKDVRFELIRLWNFGTPMRGYPAKLAAALKLITDGHDDETETDPT